MVEAVNQKEQIVGAVAASAREIRGASEKLYSGWNPSHDELEVLRDHADRIRLAIVQNGYDHQIAETASKEMGLTQMIQTPARGETYFETPPGTALLPLWEKIIVKENDTHGAMYTKMHEAFFTVATLGMESENSRVLFDTILNAKPSDRINGLRHRVFEHLKGESSFVTKNIKARNSDPIAASRLEATTNHFLPLIQNRVLTN